MSCIYCTSQPLDPSPCECSHAPCIHDRNRDIASLNEQLTKFGGLKEQVTKLGTELRDMRSSILDSRTPGGPRGFPELLRANTLAHIEELIELCDKALK